MSLVSGYTGGHHSWITCKHGLMGHAPLTLPKPHRQQKPLECMADRCDCELCRARVGSHVKKRATHLCLCIDSHDLIVACSGHD